MILNKEGFTENDWKIQMAGNKGSIGSGWATEYNNMPAASYCSDFRVFVTLNNVPANPPKYNVVYSSACFQ